FAVLVHPTDGLAGETVPDRKDVRLTLVEMHQTVRGAYPQAAIAAAQEASGARHRIEARRRMSLDFAADEPFDTVPRGQKRCAAVVLHQVECASRARGNAVVSWRPRLPPPQARRSGYPEVSQVVLVQSRDL